MAFFLSDDLTQQDKIDELEKIRLLLKQYGADAAEVASSPADGGIAAEVERIIGHFQAGWDKKVSDTELFQIVQRCSMLIGQVLEFENELDGNVDTCSNLVQVSFHCLFKAQT